MYEIVVASRNKKKIAELEALLGNISSAEIKILSLDDIGFTSDIEEDGVSFEENSAIKASVPAALGYIGFADDSGLAVDALGGAPGIFSARYSGEGATDEKNNEKLLLELENAEDRSAGYVCAVSLAIPEKMLENIPEKYIDGALSEYASKKCGKKTGIISVRGECRGEITRTPAGDGGFGYDPYFYFPSLGKTFAEILPEEKHAVSHRGEAMRKICKIIEEIF